MLIDSAYNENQLKMLKKNNPALKDLISKLDLEIQV